MDFLISLYSKNWTVMIDWDDFDMHEDDEDYIESQKRKQLEEELLRNQQ